MKKSIKDYTDKELRELANKNHLWLSAFGCVNPTAEFKQQIGEQILNMLNNTEMRDSFGISKMIILTINKS